MKPNNTFSFDSFKDMVKNDDNFKQNLTKKEDLIDIENGVMRIHHENLMKYLEEYSCKNAEDLEDTLWYSYVIYCTVI